jgi:hypothetical protein
MQPLAQCGASLANFACRAWAVLTEICQHLFLRLCQPLLRIGNPTAREYLRGASPLGGDKVTGRRRMHEPHHRRCCHPQGSPHAVVPDEASIGVQRPLHGLDGWMHHPCHRRQEHSDWVRRVQGHQAVGNLGQVVGPGTRQQPVTLSQPGPALLGVDVFAQGLTLPDR